MDLDLALALAGAADGVLVRLHHHVAGGGFHLPEQIDRTWTPRFDVRGIQPFHDFPMGPDWWQPPFWKALATNMVKLKLNLYNHKQEQKK